MCSSYTGAECVTALCSVQVEGVCKGILHMLGSMTAEYTALLTRLAVDQQPLEIGHELHVGQLPPLPAFPSCPSSSSQLTDPELICT